MADEGEERLRVLGNVDEDWEEAVGKEYECNVHESLAGTGAEDLGTTEEVCERKRRRSGMLRVFPVRRGTASEEN